MALGTLFQSKIRAWGQALALGLVAFLGLFLSAWAVGASVPRLQILNQASLLPSVSTETRVLITAPKDQEFTGVQWTHLDSRGFSRGRIQTSVQQVSNGLTTTTPRFFLSPNDVVKVELLNENSATLNQTEFATTIHFEELSPAIFVSRGSQEPDILFESEDGALKTFWNLELKQQSALRMHATGLLSAKCENRSQVELWYKTHEHWLKHPSIFVSSPAQDPSVQIIEWDPAYLPESWDIAQVFLRVPNCDGTAIESPTAVLRRSPEIFRRPLTAPLVPFQDGFATPGLSSPSDNISKVLTFASDLQNWEERKRRLQAHLQWQMKLYPWPAKQELKAFSSRLRQRQGYTIENVSFESTPGRLVTGNLYRPLRQKGPHAAVLIAHGHFEKEARRAGGYSPRSWPETQALAARLAQMGSVVWAWDMVGYGDSRQLPHDYKKVPNMIQIQTWNSIRSIDYLLSLKNENGEPLVDPTRIGVTGASGGGTQSLFLQALDPRVAAYMPVAMIAAGFNGGGSGCENGMDVHAIPGAPDTNNTELSALMAPKPSLFVSVQVDWTRWFHKEEFPYVKAIYNLYGAAQNTNSVHLREEHNYGPSKRQLAYDFFGKTFGLDQESAEPTHFEPAEAMWVFDPTHLRQEM